MEKIKTVEPITPVKNIIFVPIKSVSVNITIPVEFICDRIPMNLLRTLFLIM